MGICFSLVCDVISMLFSSDVKIVDEILLEYNYAMPKQIQFLFLNKNSAIFFFLSQYSPSVYVLLLFPCFFIF